MNSKLVWRDTSKDFTSWKLAEMSLYTTKGMFGQAQAGLNLRDPSEVTRPCPFGRVRVHEALANSIILTLDSFITIQMLTGRPDGIFSDIAIDSISVSQCQCNSGPWISQQIFFYL